VPSFGKHHPKIIEWRNLFLPSSARVRHQRLRSLKISLHICQRVKCHPAYHQCLLHQQQPIVRALKDLKEDVVLNAETKTCFITSSTGIYSFSKQDKRKQAINVSPILQKRYDFASPKTIIPKSTFIISLHNIFNVFAAGIS
jgi:hypothetical protein